MSCLLQRKKEAVASYQARCDAIGIPCRTIICEDVGQDVGQAIVVR